MSTWPFIAEINIYPYTFTPLNYTRCNGQLLAIGQNQALFSLIGTLYGGDGRTTLGVPNLQGRTPMHWGHAPGLDYYQLGELGGYSSVTLFESNLPTHNHDWTVILEGDPDTTQAPDSSMGVASDGSATIWMYSKTAQEASDNFSQDAVSFEGANDGHENRQPWLALSFFMALDGQYPARS